MTEDDVYANAIEEQAANALEHQLGGLLACVMTRDRSWAKAGTRIWLRRPPSSESNLRIQAFEYTADGSVGALLGTWKNHWYVEGLDHPKYKFLAVSLAVSPLKAGE